MDNQINTSERYPRYRYTDIQSSEISLPLLTRKVEDFAAKWGAKVEDVTIESDEYTMTLSTYTPETDEEMKRRLEQKALAEENRRENALKSIKTAFGEDLYDQFKILLDKR